MQDTQASDEVHAESSAHVDEVVGLTLVYVCPGRSLSFNLQVSTSQDQGVGGEEPATALADEITQHEVATEEREAAAEERVASPAPVHDVPVAKPEPPSAPKLEQLPVERPPAQYHHANMKVQWDKSCSYLFDFMNRKEDGYCFVNFRYHCFSLSYG